MKRLILVLFVAAAVPPSIGTAGSPVGTITAALEVQDVCDIVITGATRTSTGGNNTITVSVSDGTTTLSSTTGTANGRDGFYVHAFSLDESGVHTITAVATLRNKTTVLDMATVTATADCAWAV